MTPLPTALQISGDGSAGVQTPVQFRSDVADPQGLSFHWDFGDGSSSVESSPSHLYTRAGDYEVKLTVRNEEGAEKSTSFNIGMRHLAIVSDRVCSGGATQGWCWQRPLPSGNAVEDILFIDANVGWAVGGMGQILKTVDGGSTWTPQRSHVDVRLTHVRFANPTTGWIAGQNGTVLHTTDAGATWTRQATDVSSPDWPVDPGLVVLDDRRVVVTPGSYSTRTTVDAGQTWSSSVVHPEVVTAAGTFWQNDSYRLVKATSLGADTPVVSFGDTFNVSVRRFTMGDEQHGLLTAHDWQSSMLQMHRTTDAGANWHPVAAAGLPVDDVEYLQLVDRHTAWAATYGSLYRSVDAGQSWTALQLPVDSFVSPWQPIVARDAQTLWFAHRNGFYLTTNGGGTWTWLRVEQEQNSPDKLQMNAGGWWLKYEDRTYRSRDNGLTWTQSFGTAVTEPAVGLSSVWFFDANEGFATGADGTFLKTLNGGRDWVSQPRPVDHLYGESRLQFVSRSVGWMSHGAGIAKTTDGGATWTTPVFDSGLQRVSAFHFIDANGGWAISVDGNLFRSVDGGATWATPLTYFWGANDLRFVSDRVGFIVGDSGRIFRTEDGGETWDSRPTGVFENLNRVTFVDAATGWAVGDNGAVVTSSDGGLSWNALPVPSGQRLLDVVFVDALHGWIVGEQGTVLSTKDGGRTWAATSTGSSRVLRSAFFLDPYTGWVVGSGGAVLATATGGR